MTSLAGCSSFRYPRLPSMMPRARSTTLPSLRTELLATFAILALAALDVRGGERGAALRRCRPGARQRSISACSSPPTCSSSWHSARYKLRQLVLLPLSAAAATAEEIADGDLHVRIPDQRFARAPAACREREPHDRAPAPRAGAARARREARQRGPARRRHRARDRESARCAQRLRPPAALRDEGAHRLARPSPAWSGKRRASTASCAGCSTTPGPVGPIPTPIDINDTLRRVVDLLSAQGLSAASRS